MKFVRKRLQIVKCEKCEFFDISHVFAEDDKYLTFDRDELVAYADNTGHITAAGVKLCEPVFEKLAKKVMDNV
ncbi:hypothetical protein GCK72_017247 [Caenorhabditis remanei]|uniref:SGNH domain-containing protein n=1 Tax=Caenorhabditis remanei TaxID=31234 RepID=A0A6A5G782_CAERE|nr:hypothetical protein GCK72_017247 [Caenorhabditis remanei]KAF1750696.1 hypothetical protein GCK72_017247 [Caenorhabditis remanei]